MYYVPITVYPDYSSEREPMFQVSGDSGCSQSPKLYLVKALGSAPQLGNLGFTECYHNICRNIAKL